MQSVDQLLDAVKLRHALPSDYKLAHYLGLTIGAIGHYRHGRSLPDDRACQKIGEALGIDGDVLAAQMLARRAKDEDTRIMWTRIASRLSDGLYIM
jgi:transcriptional regulator with XRE-family HTH domain